MQAIIMAAGLGSRIHKITNEYPKSFLEVNEEKLISRAVRLLRERGIDEIVIVTGYRAKDFYDLLGETVQYRHNPLYFCTNVLSSFAVGMDYLTDEFIYLHADTIFSPKILDELMAFESNDIVLPVDFKACVEEEMKVLTSNGRITRIDKGIDLASAEGEFIGVAKVSCRVLESLKSAVTSELVVGRRFDEYFEAAIQALIDRDIPVIPLDVGTHPWIEIDFPEDYEAACKMFHE